jgi:hypothetical protein
MSKARAFVFLSGACAAALGGCISSQPPSQTGIRIGDATLKQFEAGVTTEDWLVAVIGPPTSKSTLKTVENTKVYRYVMGQSAGGLGALLSGEASKNTAVVYFIITDGIVTRFWADRETETRLFGDPVEKPGGEKSGTAK